MEDDTKDEGVTEEGTTEEIIKDEVSEEAIKDESIEKSVEENTEESTKDTGYQFDDDLSSSEPTNSAPASTPTHGGSGGFAEEIFSKTIHAKFRTFYVDLKESRNGKFIKISEKSRGRKSTIMMDAEDMPAIIEALQEVQKQL